MPPQPLNYVAIADDLEARIGKGEHLPGTQIPSYRQLADLYSVSVSTASQAVALLRDRGVVRGVTGRGVYVA